MCFAIFWGCNYDILLIFHCICLLPVAALFVSIISQFAFAINLTLRLFTFYSFFLLSLTEKEPLPHWQRFFSTQPHGLRHFEFLAVTRTAMWIRSGLHLIQSYTAHTDYFEIDKIDSCISILCSRIGYNNANHRLQRGDLVLILCLLYSYIIANTSWPLPPVLFLIGLP